MVKLTYQQALAIGSNLDIKKDNIYHSIMKTGLEETRFSIQILDDYFLEFQFKNLYDSSELSLLNDFLPINEIKIKLVNGRYEMPLSTIGVNKSDLELYRTSPNSKEAEETKLQIARYIFQTITDQFFHKWWTDNVIKQVIGLFEEEMHRVLSSIINPIGLGIQYTKDQSLMNITVFRKGEEFKIYSKLDFYCEDLDVLDGDFFRTQLLAVTRLAMQKAFRNNQFPVNVSVELVNNV